MESIVESPCPFDGLAHCFTAQWTPERDDWADICQGCGRTPEECATGGPLTVVTDHQNFLNYDPVYWEQQVKDHPHTEPLGQAEQLLQINWDDPIERWALARAEIRDARLVSRPCAYGQCTELWDPVTDTNTGGYGVAGCPCQGS